MSGAITILVQDRKTGQRRNLTLEIDADENIAELTKNVEKLTHIPSDELEVVFCGKKLSKSTMMKELSLTPATKRIPVTCEDCCASNLFAEFKFKCLTCNDLAAALTHVRGNWQMEECCVCDNKEKIIFDLGCNHISCKNCFREYLLSTLNSFNFINKPPYGYTISCPYQGCNKVVKDVHHFHIMGQSAYSEYQRKATERLILVDDEGVTCPNALCGQSFFWEPYDDDGRSQCPDCFYTFCRKCTEKECVCQSDDDLTKSTIDATTRRCPNCNVATERNGGCSHIHCTSCGMDWCFKCVTAWREECQWDHWFN
uniref:RBR-type E3 ubiquitin transferase n=1 Tax=Caenorhabditis tropicalis TaxID=1561998 RepID=A0A1I7TM01_9PELO